MSTTMNIKAKAAPKRQRRAAKPQPVPAVELNDEDRLLGERFAMALRRMDERRRSAALTLVNCVEELALKHPRHTAPVLRLVSGGDA